MFQILYSAVISCEQSYCTSRPRLARNVTTVQQLQADFHSRSFPVCRHHLSSVTRVGSRPPPGWGAWLVWQPTLHDGTVRLHPVRVTPCFSYCRCDRNLTRIETDDRQTYINVFIKRYRKKGIHIISITWNAKICGFRTFCGFCGFRYLGIWMS